MGPELFSFVSAGLLAVAIYFAPAALAPAARWPEFGMFWLCTAAAGCNAVAAGRLWIAKDADWVRALQLGGATACIVLAGALAFAFVSHKPISERPGAAVFAVIRIADQQVERRRYYFDAGHDDSQGAAFYRSASDKFIFEVRDGKGESYPLELTAGRKGVPIGEWIIFRAEAAIEGKTTVLRAFVGRKLLAERTLPFPLDLSKTMTSGMTLFSDSKKTNNGAAELGPVDEVDSQII